MRDPPKRRMRLKKKERRGELNGWSVAGGVTSGSPSSCSLFGLCGSFLSFSLSHEYINIRSESTERERRRRTSCVHDALAFNGIPPSVTFFFFSTSRPAHTREIYRPTSSSARIIPRRRRLPFAETRTEYKKKERKINTVVLLRICVEASATSNAGQVRSPLLAGLRPALRLTAKSRRFTTLFWPLEASHFPPLSLTFPLQQQHTDKKERKEDDKNVRVEMLCVSMARLISTQSSYRSNKIFPQPSIKLRSSKKKKSYLPIGFATKSRNTANLDSRAFIRELSTLSREKYGQ